MAPNKRATRRASKKASPRKASSRKTSSKKAAPKKAASKSRQAPAKASKKAARPARAAAKKAVKKVVKAAKKVVKKAVKKAAAKTAKGLMKGLTAMKALPPPSPNTVLIENVSGTAMPYLRKGVPAEMFAALRSKVIREAGFDFLSVFGDMMRPRNLTTNKPGVAQRSRHKCGDAFDYNQGEARLSLVKDPRDGRMYWRTYLRCAKQDGSQGEALRIQNQQIVAGPANGFYYDFTSAAEALGWHRIPAHPGWQSSWNKREFWHYQNVEGYSYDEVMQLLYGNAAAVPKRPRFPTLSPGSRDSVEVNTLKDVRQLQAQLYLLKLIFPLKEVDGIYGGKTTDAVKAFQQKEGLTVTGIADEATRSLILQRVL